MTTEILVDTGCPLSAEFNSFHSKRASVMRDREENRTKAKPQNLDKEDWLRSSVVVFFYALALLVLFFDYEYFISVPFS